jgi:hypothetical protein
MRTILLNAVWIIGLVAALAWAGWWGQFIWSFDWGHSYRGRGLWMMALGFPSVLGGMLIFFVVFALLSTLWEFIFREDFPA